MDFYNRFPLRTFSEWDRLDMRDDHRPLASAFSVILPQECFVIAQWQDQC
jgi:hypothetical protein